MEVVYGSDKYSDTPSVKVLKKMLKLAGVSFRQYVCRHYL